MDHHGVPALHNRVLQLVQAHRLLLVETRPKILALEHLLEGHPRIEFHHLLKGHHLKPLAVEDRAGALRVEDFIGLLLEGARIFHHLVVGELRAGFRAARGIADHRGEVADDEDGVVAEVLELPQFREPDGEAEVDVRRGRIDAELHVQRAAKAQFREQFRFGDDLRGTAFEDGELVFGRHEMAGGWTVRLLD